MKNILPILLLTLISCHAKTPFKEIGKIKNLSLTYNQDMTISENHLYVTEQENGNWKSLKITAYDLPSQKKLWESSYGRKIIFPENKDTPFYLMIQNQDESYTFLNIDPQSGKILKQKTLNESHLPLYADWYSYQGSLYAFTNRDIIKFNPQTGQRIWYWQTTNLSISEGRRFVLFDHDKVMIYAKENKVKSDKHFLLQISLEDGKLQKQTLFKDKIYQMYFGKSHSIFISQMHEVIQIDKDGNQLFNLKQEDFIHDLLINEQFLVLLTKKNKTFHLKVYNLSNMEVVWKKEADFLANISLYNNWLTYLIHSKDQNGLWLHRFDQEKDLELQSVRQKFVATTEFAGSILEDFPKAYLYPPYLLISQHKHIKILKYQK